MSAYGSNYSSPATSTSTSNTTTSISTPSTQIPNTNAQITASRTATPAPSATQPSGDVESNISQGSSIEETSLLAANMEPMETAAQVAVEGYEYAVELQFATKTNFFYSASDKYAAGSSEDPGGPLLTTSGVAGSDPSWPQYRGDEQ